MASLAVGIGGLGYLAGLIVVFVGYAVALGIGYFYRIAVQCRVVSGSGGIAFGISSLGQIAVRVVAVLAGEFLLTAILGIIQPDFFFGQ